MSHRTSDFDSPHDTRSDNGTPGLSLYEDSTVSVIQDDSDPNPYHSLESYVNNYSDSSYEYDTFSYQFHDFEENIYTYVWIILVILTAFGNIIIVAVFVRKSMLTPTTLILLFIAISDSLTGLVTLPTYMYVFTTGKQGWVSLNESWCEAFMICKFYVPKAFHTVSTWLTALLGFQRFFCIWFPLKAKSWFTIYRIFAAIAVFIFCAFVVHAYHLIVKKANKIDGMCQWAIENPCMKSCTFLWIILLLVNILPCVLLLVLTILMIQKLFHRNIGRMSINFEQSRERNQQNKTVSITVVCIAIIFLIPEIPYGIFLLVTVIRKHSGQELLALRENRLFHAVYEITLLLSFHANFWIYIIMSRQFRGELKSMFLEIPSLLLPKRVSVTRSSVSVETRQTQHNSMMLRDVNETSTFV